MLNYNLGKFRALLTQRGISLAGTFSVAGANFITMLIMSKVLSPWAFGVATLNITLAQFSNGILNALVVTPLTSKFDDGKDFAASSSVTIPILLLISIVVFATAVALHVSFLGALLIALSTFLQGFRWICRGYSFATSNIANPFYSDVTFTFIMLISIGSIEYLHNAGISSLFFSIALANAVAIQPFKWGWAFRSLSISSLLDYKPIWRRQSKWSSIGVVVTEVTANSYSYLIVLFAGPGAFAPVALASLLWRPVSVCVSALTSIERVNMVREMKEHYGAMPIRAASIFMVVTVGTALITSLAIALVWQFFPNVVSHQGRDATELAIFVVGAVTFARAIREPLGVMMQAAGQYRLLTGYTTLSCCVGVSAVVAILLLGYPTLSVMGAGFAELALTGVLVRWLTTELKSNGK